MSGDGLYEQVMASASQETLPTVRVRASAGVVPWRRDGHGELEVFWVERSPDLPFMGGFHAFPGGGRAGADTSLEVAGLPQGSDEAPEDGAMPEAVLDGIDLEPLLAAGIAGCVVRETFEETGLLLGSGGQRNDLPGWRNRLLRKEVSFNQAVEYAKWRLDVSRLVYAGRWLTPPLGPIRFDNRFFLLEWAVDEPVQPEVCGSELVAGEWIRPKEALARWRRGDVVTAPPILHILTVLSESGPISGLDRLRSPLETNLGPHRRIEFRPGVLLFPLPTRTLPPANHTNTFVLGTGELVVVDPGSPYPEQNEGLIAALRDLARGEFHSSVSSGRLSRDEQRKRSDPQQAQVTLLPSVLVEHRFLLVLPVQCISVRGSNVHLRSAAKSWRKLFGERNPNQLAT